MKLSDQDKIDIVEKYKTGKFTCKELGRIYGVHGNSISSMLKRRGIEIKHDQSVSARKYKINEHYFDQIDTEEKAYFLGLLYADGYNNEKSHCISIELQSRDAHILKRFNIALGSNRALLFIGKRKESHQDSYRAMFNNKILSKTLAELGCVQAKSLILKFPTEEQVPKHLQKHFIRGYFDGDGSVCLHEKRNTGYYEFTASLISSKDFCESLQKCVESYLDIGSHLSSKNNHPITRTWRTNGSQNAIKFLDWIYSDSTIYLQRKYDSYLEGKEKIDSRRDDKLFEAFGEKKIIKSWSRDSRCVVSSSTIKYRIDRGWTLERAITSKRQDGVRI